MRYTLENGKAINIPNAEIEKSMKNLGLSKEEAIEMYLEDEGYLDNAEQNELDSKAKAVKVNVGARADSKPRKPREPKVDEVKEDLVKNLAEYLENVADNVVIVNKSKIIQFNLGEDTYKIDLIRQRKPKN